MKKELSRLSPETVADAFVAGELIPARSVWIFRNGHADGLGAVLLTRPFREPVPLDECGDVALRLEDVASRLGLDKKYAQGFFLAWSGEDESCGEPTWISTAPYQAGFEDGTKAWKRVARLRREAFIEEPLPPKSARVARG